MVGIYGIGGIGKTTIARAVYNMIVDQFDGSCFLSDIRGKASDNHGLAQLQETLLSDILGETDIKIGDVNKGIPLIKRRLQQKKVFLILDDADKMKQLKAIAGGSDWFGSGSRIIVISRDKHLLAAHGVMKLYEVEELNRRQAIELFSWNAFKRNEIDPSYAHLSILVLSYANGLPLALEVIGANLYGKSIEEWSSALDKYERVPNGEVYEILKVSYDGLEEDEKKVFLDIACFFNRHEKLDVQEFLHVRGFHPENSIRVLIDKSLIKIEGFDRVRMHDLIQDMGREIVRQESISEPGKRSRLWFHEDILYVLQENTMFDSLSWMNFDGCEFLTQVPDLSGLPNLRTLCLDNCSNLTKIHDSNGFLLKLNCLSAQRCSKLHSFARRIWLPSLETLDLGWCTSLRSFPEVQDIMENIRDVRLDNTAIEELPFSIQNLIGLERLYLCSCTNLNHLPSSISLLPKLEVIINYYGPRGFQLYESDKVQEKVISKVIKCHSLHVNVVGKVELQLSNVNCVFVSDNNIIQGYSPLRKVTLSKQCFIRKGKSSVSFWFREKFPAITLLIFGIPGLDIDMSGSVLEFRFFVHINSTNLFTYSSVYLVSASAIKADEPSCLCVFLDNLHCKFDQGIFKSVISEHEWNHVEVSYELKYHTSGDPELVTSGQNRNIAGTMSWSSIHVDEKNTCVNNILFKNPTCVDDSDYRQKSLCHAYILFLSKFMKTQGPKISN